MKNEEERNTIQEANDRKTIQESIAIPYSRSNQRTPTKIQRPLSQNGLRGATIHLHLLQIGDSSK